jgi:Holliday junction resolvasome RuvABC endonuclease subunit
MSILALDLSSKATGYAIAKNGEMVGHGVITSSSKDVVKRIYIMRDTIRQLIQDNGVRTVVVEEVRPDGSNPQIYKVLSWLQAAIVFMIYDLDKTIEIKYVYPSEWRHKLSLRQGRGVTREEQKKASIAYVQSKFCITVSDDEADAICLLQSQIRKPVGAW